MFDNYDVSLTSTSIQVYTPPNLKNSTIQTFINKQNNPITIQVCEYRYVIGSYYTGVNAHGV